MDPNGLGIFIHSLFQPRSSWRTRSLANPVVLDLSSSRGLIVWPQFFVSMPRGAEHSAFKCCAYGHGSSPVVPKTAKIYQNIKMGLCSSKLSKLLYPLVFNDGEVCQSQDGQETRAPHIFKPPVGQWLRAWACQCASWGQTSCQRQVGGRKTCEPQSRRRWKTSVFIYEHYMTLDKII